MTNQETDEQDIDNGSVSQDETDDQAQDDNNESGTNKNKSNFKALAKAKRELEKSLQEKDTRLEELETELNQWRELNAGTAKELDKSKDVDSIKEEIFILKNQEAEPYLKEVRSTMQKYNMNYNEAWKFVKLDIPAESLSKTDFNISKTSPKKPLDLSKVSPEDSLNLSKEDRSKWRKLNGYA